MKFKIPFALILAVCFTANAIPPANGIFCSAWADTSIDVKQPPKQPTITIVSSPKSEKLKAEIASTLSSESADLSELNVTVVFRSENDLDLTIDKATETDEFAFKHVSWRIEAKSSEQAHATLLKKLANFRQSLETREEQRKAALSFAAPLSKTIFVDPNSGEFRDRASGTPLALPEAQSRFVSESPKHKNYLRGALEIGTMIGAGWLIYYTALAEANEKDWDYKPTYSSQSGKLLKGQGIRFDDNPFYFNNGHAFAGTYYYLFARTNGFSSLESTLISIAASALWETLVEYHEVLSINDMIATPIGGAAIGEVFFQLGTYFNSASPTGVHKTLAALLGGPDAIHRWLDKNKAKNNLELDSLGFDTNAWHQFDLFAGIGATTRDGASNPMSAAETRLGVSADLITIPGYGKEGTAKEFLKDTSFSRLFIDTSLGTEGLNEFRFFAQAALFGYYQQNISKDSKGSLRGGSFFLGASTAYDLVMQKTMGVYDQSGVVNILGPSMEAVLYYKGFRIRARFDVFADFAQIRSLAVEKYFAKTGYDQMIEDAKNSGNPDLVKAAEKGRVTGLRSILEQEQAYYAMGATATSELVVEYGSFEAGGKLKGEAFTSIQGGDRFNGTKYNTLSDSRVTGTVWVAYKIPKSNLLIKLEAENTSRQSQIEDTEVEISEERVTGSAVWRF
ncbi:DUF3943 domain-containing protein [Bdellovibrionota bacterium FG-2]